MERRPLGLGVVLVVLLAALAMPLFLGRRIAGSPVALAIPAEPHVGDCLLDLAPVPPSSGDVDRPPAVVSCASQHRGEVVTMTPTTVAHSAMNGGRAVQVPNVAACAETAYLYMGLHPLDGSGRRSGSLGPWWPGFSAEFAMVRPSPVQVRLGQSWTACVLTSPHGLISGAAAQLYAGSPRPSPIALCSASSEIALYVSTPCEQAHAAEILGWRVTDQSSNTQASFGQSCTELAQRMTGMSDPTADGALGLAVVIIGSGDAKAHEGWGPGHSGPYRAACTISTAASRQLTGSLAGLGDAPLPWK